MVETASNGVGGGKESSETEIRGKIRPHGPDQKKQNKTVSPYMVFCFVLVVEFVSFFLKQDFLM